MRWFFPYEGGKSRETELLGLLDFDFIDKVVEPFAGSHAWSRFLFDKYPHLQFQINDINPNLIRFLKWIRKTPNPLRKLKSHMAKNLNRTYRLSLFDKLEANKPLTPKEYYFLNKVQWFRPTRSADPFVNETRLRTREKNIEGTIKKTIEEDNPDELFAVEFLKSPRVKITQLDWKTVVKRNSNPKTLIRMDPPYEGTDSVSYNSSFNLDEIPKVKKKNKATFLVSWGRKDKRLGKKPLYITERGAKGKRREDATSELLSVGYLL